MGTNTSGHSNGDPIRFDPRLESRLRLKIDLYIVPTVAILYMFCFIDRANLGTSAPQAIADAYTDPP